jgi:hypothetical protein
MFSIATWLFFLFIYSQAVQTPLDSQDEKHLSEWEWILYILTVSFLLDGESEVELPVGPVVCHGTVALTWILLHIAGANKVSLCRMCWLYSRADLMDGSSGTFSCTSGFD